jgi:hypothetical protein
MQQAGYDAAACEKVKRWILKKDIKTDAENQVQGSLEPCSSCSVAVAAHLELAWTAFTCAPVCRQTG